MPQLEIRLPLLAAALQLALYPAVVETREAPAFPTAHFGEGMKANGTPADCSLHAGYRF